MIRKKILIKIVYFFTLVNQCKELEKYPADLFFSKFYRSDFLRQQFGLNDDMLLIKHFSLCLYFRFQLHSKSKCKL